MNSVHAGMLMCAHVLTVSSKTRKIVCTYEKMCTLWPHPPSVNCKKVCMQLLVYHFVQAAVYVVHNLEVVRYSHPAIALHIIWRLQLVHTAVTVIW